MQRRALQGAAEMHSVDLDSLLSPTCVYALLQPQALPNPSSNLLLEFRPPLPPHLCRLHIRRTLIIRLRQHAHH